MFFLHVTIVKKCAVKLGNFSYEFLLYIKNPTTPIVAQTNDAPEICKIEEDTNKFISRYYAAVNTKLVPNMILVFLGELTDTFSKITAEVGKCQLDDSAMRFCLFIVGLLK